MADKQMGVIDAVLLDGRTGSVVGVLSTPEEHMPRIGAAIRRGAVEEGYAGGITLQPSHQPEPGVYVLGEACTLEKPRPCELGFALGRVQELAKEAGIGAPAIEAIEHDGRFTEAEARDAVRATVDAMPKGAAKTEAERWDRVTFQGTAARV